MTSSHFYSRLRVIDLLLLLLSFLSIVTALPGQFTVPDDVTKTKDGKPKTLITEQMYLDYVKEHFSDKLSHLIFYTGESEDQVIKFKMFNPGYLYYDDIFNARSTDHPWYETWDPDFYLDDAEASSKVLAKLATTEVLIFGGAEWDTFKGDSFFKAHEADILLAKVKSGELRPLKHMVKNAISPDQVMITEDGDKKFTWQPGYKEGTTNASGRPDEGAPSIKSKSSRNSSPVSFGCS